MPAAPHHDSPASDTPNPDVRLGIRAPAERSARAPGGEESPTSAKRITPEDQEFLDDLLDRALAAIEDGQPLAASEISDERVHLRGSIGDTLRLAREIAVGDARGGAPEELP